MKTKTVLFFLSCFVNSNLFAAGLQTNSLQPQTESLPAGSATVASRRPSSFEKHSSNLSAPDRIRKFNIGNDFFANPWIPSSTSTSLRDGLGPTFNNNACQACHIRDGRGDIPEPTEINKDKDRFASILIRTAKTSIKPEQQQRILESKIANVGDSSTGPQLQHRSIIGVKREASLELSYQYSNVTFNDGFIVELRKPVWKLQSNYRDEGHDFDPDTLFSPRLAQPMIGLGLLSLISENDILRNVDAQANNKDGISGKANRVWNIESQQVELGRFGWKAGQPTIKQQTVAAFLNDMGLTSSLLPNDSCLAHQLDCINAQNGNGDSTKQYNFEVSDKVLEKVVFYASNLGVPIRYNAHDNTVQKGKELFRQAGCSSCHTESYTTQKSEVLAELSNQTIYPYTDLLLHDMGANLADFFIDNTPGSDTDLFEFLASAREWRTPPLWGLGLTQTVNPQASFLHDGRARNILEAVLWHGGEAEKAKQQVLSFNKNQRDALLAFLNDL